jgi:radical SAM superfamily enzyme YgiQ (UPF0313 family)
LVNDLHGDIHREILSDIKPVNVLLTTSVSGKGFNIAPPLGLYRLQHYLQERGIYCDILDLDIDNKDEAVAKVGQGFYDIIGLSVSHYNMEEDLDLLWQFQTVSRESGKECLFLGGGQEATLNYEQWLNAGLDIIVTGFAEKSLYQICQGLSNGTLSKNQIPNINGIVFRNEKQSNIFYPNQVLTKLEFEELSYSQMLTINIPYERYWTVVRHSIAGLNFNTSKFVAENIRLYTTSHCPRGCGFCSSQAFIPTSQSHKAAILMLSAEQIYALVLKYISEYGAKGFLFSDDDFIVGNEKGLRRIFDFCNMIINAKSKGEISQDIMFNCQARVADFLKSTPDGKKIINHELLELLSKAGFHSFGLGVETFSERLLQCPSINKVGINVNECLRVLDALLESGADPQINIILGIPEATVDELIGTMRVAVDYIVKGCQTAVTPKLYCIPGAPLSQMDNYRVNKKNRVNPFTEKKVEITNHVIPSDPGIAYMVENIQSTADEELKTLIAGTAWETSKVPKSIQGIAMFIAAAKLLNRNDVADEFREEIKKKF